MSFLRRKRDTHDDASAGTDAADETKRTEASDSADAAGASGDDQIWPGADKARPHGPFDIEDVDDAITRIDFGALRVPASDGMEVRLDVDDEGRISAVAVALEGTVLQLQVFAAPRTLGLWDDVRAEMIAAIAGSGGKAEEDTGPFGPELVAQVPTDATKPGSGLQPVRFLGVDGPRWFLRGVISGDSGGGPTDLAAAHDVFRNVVVVRGDAAAPPRELLLLTMPDDPSLRSEPPGQH